MDCVLHSFSSISIQMRYQRSLWRDDGGRKGGNAWINFISVLWTRIIYGLRHWLSTLSCGGSRAFLPVEGCLQTVLQHTAQCGLWQNAPKRSEILPHHYCFTAVSACYLLQLPASTMSADDIISYLLEHYIELPSLVDIFIAPPHMCRVHNNCILDKMLL